MGQHRRWGTPIAERVRRSVRAVTRLQFLAVAATVVAAIMTIALLPHGMSDAATTAAPAAAAATPNDDGVTWNPNGNAVQSNDGSGYCELAMSGSVSAPDSGTVSTVDAALNDEPADSVNQDDVGDLTISAPAGESGSTSMTVYADAGVDCSLVNQTDAYIKKTGYGSLGQFSQAVLDADLHPAAAGTRQYAEQHAVLLAYDALPSWLKGAIGAITGAVVYVAVSVITVSTMVALGAATSATGGLAAPALAAFAGCVGGAISTAVTLAIAGSATTPLGIVSSGVAGCLTGGLIAQIPAGTAGVWLGNTFRSNLGLEASAVAGNAIATDAAAAGVELSPYAQAMQDALTGLANP